MADLFRTRYLRVSAEAGLSTASSVLQRLGDSMLVGGGEVSRSLRLGGATLTASHCAVLCRALQHDTHFTEMAVDDALLSGGPGGLPEDLPHPLPASQYAATPLPLFSLAHVKLLIRAIS